MGSPTPELKARQLRLFDHPRPLLDRLGAAFFRAVPKEPGVYIMRDGSGRILYIGQSRNLRHRLGSYKNAHPDHTPRKTLRLVHLVQSIAWEPCASADAARLRENELLRQHRPSFNRVNVYPKAYFFAGVRFEGPRLHVRLTHEEASEEEEIIYGAFKGHARLASAALLRLLWAAQFRPASPHEYPRILLAQKPPNLLSLDCERLFAQAGDWPAAVHGFFEGGCYRLLNQIEEWQAQSPPSCAFMASFCQQDMELVRQFQQMGPRRNHELRQYHGWSGKTIPQEKLDDLGVLFRKSPPPAEEAKELPSLPS